MSFIYTEALKFASPNYLAALANAAPQTLRCALIKSGQGSDVATNRAAVTIANFTGLQEYSGTSYGVDIGSGRIPMPSLVVATETSPQFKATTKPDAGGANPADPLWATTDVIDEGGAGVLGVLIFEQINADLGIITDALPLLWYGENGNSTAVGGIISGIPAGGALPNGQGLTFDISSALGIFDQFTQ